MHQNWKENIWPQLDPMIPSLPDRPIFEELREQSRIRPDKTALNFYGYEITYRELDDLSDSFAMALINKGVQKGDRVALYLENCPQFVIGFYGIIKAGAVVVTCSPMYKKDELEHVLKDAEVKSILLEDNFYSVLDACDFTLTPENIISTSFADFLPSEPSFQLHSSMSTEKTKISGTTDLMDLLKEFQGQKPDVDIDLQEDLIMIQYTAGTTGLPKGVMLTHKNLAVHGALVRHYFEYSEEDVHLLVLPLFHVTGLDIALNPVLAKGSKLILFARFDLMTMLQVISEYRVTHCITITPINVAVLHAPNISDFDLSSLKLVVSGGAPVPLEVHEKWEKMVGIPIVEGYGLSEACGGIIGNNRHNYKPGTVGAPIYYHDIMLWNIEENSNTGDPERGELCIKGPCVMKGYWKNQEQTKAAFLEGGWLRTGDIAQVEEEGWVRIVGRTKEMINVSGYKVSLAEVDEFIYKHPAVAEACTIGVTHSYRGEDPKAFVVVKPEYKGQITEEEIVEFCKQQMSAYKYPRKIEFVEELPKSGAGKILRRVLEQKENNNQE